jgi:hypothetical protein
MPTYRCVTETYWRDRYWAVDDTFEADDTLTLQADPKEPMGQGMIPRHFVPVGEKPTLEPEPKGRKPVLDKIPTKPPHAGAAYADDTQEV